MSSTKATARNAGLLWALLVLVLTLAWSMLWLSQRQGESSAISQTEGDASNLARSFAEHTLASFQRVDFVVHDLRRTWLRAPHEFSLEVARHQDLMRDIAFQVGVIGADGRLDFSNLARTKERIDLSDREHFQAARQSAERGEDRLFISKPVQGRVSGKWSIQMVRPILDEGAFAGALVISIDPAFFSRFFETVQLGEGGVVTMVRDSGEILSRAPSLETALGKSITGTPYLASGAPTSGIFRRVAQVDGVDRIYGFRRLPDYGVALVVGVSANAVLAPLQIQHRSQMGLMAAISAALLGLVVAIRRGQRRQMLAAVALAKSETMLRTVFDVLPIGITLGDQHGRITDCNRTAEQILGIDRETMLSRDCDGPVWDIVRADGTPMPAEEFASVRALREQRPVYDVEMGVNRPDEEQRWLRVSAMPIAGADGGVVIAYADITERRRGQKALAASERRFRTLFESFPEMVFVVDTSGRFSLVHVPQNEWLSAVDASTWPSKPLEEILGAEVAGLLSSALAEVMADGGSQTVEFRYAFAGIERDYAATVSPMQGETAWPEGFVVVLRDVTAERLFSESQRIAATTFESQEGMMVTDDRGVILRVNRAFTELTGYEADEVVGKTPAVLKSERHDQEFYRAMWSELEFKGYWQGEVWNRRKDGELYPEWLTISAVADEQGRTTHYVGAFSDISERKEAEMQIRHLAFYDPLTELPNRRLLFDRLQQALAAGHRSRAYGALLYLDLDHFKMLNDTRGHDAGDELLIEVAARLRASVREEDTVARLGGDEFVVMIEGLGADEAAAASQTGRLAEKIRYALAEPFKLKGGGYSLTPSIGVSLFRGHEADVQVLLKQADMALYEAKEQGRNAVRFFSHAMQEVVTARVAMLAGLRDAIEHRQFELYLQPQFGVDGERLGAEALLRWLHPEQGMIMPGEFIPLAEESGLIVPIGNWVLGTACDILADWRHTRPNECLAVNVSALQFHQPDFIETLQSMLERSGAAPASLCLELTESAVLADVDAAAERMERLKTMGVIISLDDFGTGYSSLSCLKRLPIDEVKIDRSFIDEIATDPQDAAIVRAIVVMCQSLGVTVIAEGVETALQRDFLVECGCDALQGYLLGRPAPLLEYLAR